MAKFCVNCGMELKEEDKACSSCGTMVDGSNTESSNGIDNTVNTNQTNGLAIAGFVVSLVSLLCCNVISIVGLILSIFGLNNSKKMNDKGKGLAIAGIVISIVSIVLMIVLFLLISNNIINVSNNQ